MTDDLKAAAAAALYEFTAGSTIQEENHFVVGFNRGYTHALKHAPEVRTLITALETIKEFQEKAKGDMYRSNFNWLIVNKALEAFRAKVGIK